MSFKPPVYAVQNLFQRIVPTAEIVKTTRLFLMRGKCPLCSDYKKRMFCKEYPDHFHVYCHNCGYSNGFRHFIKDNFPAYQDELNEYVLESIRSGSFRKNKKKIELPSPINSIDENDMKLRCYMDDMSFCINNEQKNKSKEKCRKTAIEYCKSRNIPYEVWKEWRFFTEGPLKGYIGILMWNKNKTLLLHIQGRLLLPSKDIPDQQKYYFIKDTKASIDNIPKPLYGIWRVNPTQRVFVCEGTLDALAFGSQGVATCGAHISDTLIQSVTKQFKNNVWCPDNFWFDEVGQKLTIKLLEMGQSCFIIPKDMKSKDCNALLDELGVNEIPKYFIDKNIYKGKLGIAKLKLNI